MDLLRRIETPYVDAQTILCLLEGYANPRDWMARRVQEGNLIRLKNGLFVISEQFHKESYLLAQIGNILYGPSYVSLQWALSYYGLIPERATTVTSVTTRRNKQYRTSLGEFTYRYLNSNRYAIGVDQRGDSDGRGHFLIALPEKALIDFIFFFCKEKKLVDLEQEVFESHRIESEDIKQLNFTLMKYLCSMYRSSVVTTFSKLLQRL